jgi:uncharacterized protein (TIGR02453 family)
MPAYLTEETMKFLRGLARNNDRDWFEARRAIYERALRQPMLALVEAINAKLEGFAPAHVRPAPKCVMCIYRDIRFSANKQPYKTHLAAWWARRGMEKTSGGGFYLQAGPKGVMLAGAVYMPERAQLLRIRTWMSDHHAEYRRLLKTATGRRLGLTSIVEEAMTRMPKGFAADHPAGVLLRARHWGVRCDLPAEAALRASFVDDVVKRFQAAAPIVDALNGAILGGVDGTQETARRPLF